jgi:N-acetylneuraminic acid mutarotase
LNKVLEQDVFTLVIKKIHLQTQGVLYKDQWIIFGGITKNPKEEKNSFSFDFKNKCWKEMKTESPPSHRFGHSMNLVDSKIYIFGGESNSEYFNNIFEYDIEEDKWKEIKSENNENVPKGRSKHSSFVKDNSLFIIGGHFGNGKFEFYFLIFKLFK